MSNDSHRNDFRRRPGIRSAALFALVLLISAALAFWVIDLPLARWCFEHRSGWVKPWRDLYKGVMLSEIFGHFWGAVLALVAIAVLDRKNRTKIPRCLAALILAGLAPNLIKFFFIRYRPRYFFNPEFSGPVETVWQTLGGFTWGNTESAFQSFPSGHSALAAALAVVLYHLYPQGRRFFAALVVLVMAQRVVSAAHFPGDTLAGAALGLFCAALCMPAERSKTPDVSKTIAESPEDPDSVQQS